MGVFLRNCILLCFILGAVFEQTQQASLPTDAHYTAGVVEFRKSSASDSMENLQDNLQSYLSIIGSNEAAVTDIIVFPESTLNNNEQTTYVPEPTLGIVPCDEEDDGYYAQFLRAISCQAKKTQKYVVINLTEKEQCISVPTDPRPCASNGLNIYNTNVVFDRSGAVVSRYRKVHLYGESKNTTYVPEFGYFDTDFGVRFGHFVCFDILFYTPAQQMAQEMGITDFIFTSMWFGQLPFLTGVQFQNSWAFGNDVNLLAAGSSNPAVGSTGSGIYHGRHDPLVAVMKQVAGERQLYVAQVPKYDVSRRSRQIRAVPTISPKRLTQSDIFLKRDYLESYASEVLDLTPPANNLQRRLCYNETQLCCDFELQWQRLSNVNAASSWYTYRLGAYAGWRNEVGAEMNYMYNCAIFACVGPAIADCGRLFADDVLLQPQVAFERILITVQMPKAPQLLIMPNTLREDLLPVPVQHFEWSDTVEDDAHNLRLLLNTTTTDLMTFAVYGNYYDGELAESEDDDEGGGAASVLPSLLLLMAAAVVTLTFVF